MSKNAKEYFLMHKDIRVCLMEISDEGEIGNIRSNKAGNAAGIPKWKGYLEKRCLS